MANLADVYDISFQADTPELADALERLLKACDKPEHYYNLAEDFTRNGNEITGGHAVGRWTYSNNLENAFENPQQWFDTDYKRLKPYFDRLTKELAKGDRIEVSFSEDERGCELFQDGYGTIEYHDGKIVVSLDFDEHDRPDCDMEQTNEPEGKWYCYDHDHHQATQERYCEVAL